MSSEALLVIAGSDSDAGMVIFSGTTAASTSLIIASLLFAAFRFPNNFFRTAVAELIGFEATAVTVVVVVFSSTPTADRLATAALGVEIIAVFDLKSK